MAWFRVDDQATFNPKVVRAGNAAFGAWVRLGAYCNAQLTDGFIPDEVAKMVASKRELESLVAAGLLHVVEGGYQVHDYLEYQPSKAQVTADRAATRERVKRHRNAGRNTVTPNVANGVSTPAPSDPVPSNPKSEHTHTRAHAEAVDERVDASKLLAAWQRAGLGVMQDPSGMAELRAAFNRPDSEADPFAYCEAWKRLSAAWRRGGAKGAGESPRLMLQHMDKVHLVVTGELVPEQLDKNGTAGGGGRRFNQGIGAQPVTREE